MIHTTNYFPSHNAVRFLSLLRALACVVSLSPTCTPAVCPLPVWEDSSFCCSLLRPARIAGLARACMCSHLHTGQDMSSCSKVSSRNIH